MLFFRTGPKAEPGHPTVGRPGSIFLTGAKWKSRYSAAFSIVSRKIPYPLVGSFNKTWVTAPTNRPSWRMGLPLMSDVNKGQKYFSFGVSYKFILSHGHNDNNFEKCLCLPLLFSRFFAQKPRFLSLKYITPQNGFFSFKRDSPPVHSSQKEPGATGYY